MTNHYWPDDTSVPKLLIKLQPTDTRMSPVTRPTLDTLQGVEEEGERVATKDLNVNINGPIRSMGSTQVENDQIHPRCSSLLLVPVQV